MSACVNLPLHRKVQKFSSGTGSPGWSRKTSHKTVVVVMLLELYRVLLWPSFSELLPIGPGPPVGIDGAGVYYNFTDWIPFLGPTSKVK